jgi:hypothetical protein
MISIKSNSASLSRRRRRRQQQQQQSAHMRPMSTKTSIDLACNIYQTNNINKNLFISGKNNNKILNFLI